MFTVTVNENLPLCVSFDTEKTCIIFIVIFNVEKYAKRRIRWVNTV